MVFCECLNRRGIDQGSVSELVHTLTSVLARDFDVKVGTSEITASAPELGVQDNVKRVVLVGASILKKVVPHLTGQGLEVVDLCTPGWKVTPESVSELAGQLSRMNPGSNTAFILDLYGNSVTRAIIFDGSSTVAMKGAGGYHLPGRVSVCTNEIFGNLIELTMPIFEAVAANIRIIVPPQPRYLFQPCCNDRHHCTNVGQQGHADRLLSDTVHLRTQLKKKVISFKSGLTWVMDTCCGVSGTDDKPVPDKLAALRGVMTQDGVHLTDEGSKNFAVNIVETLARVQSGKCGKKSALFSTAAVNISGGSRHIWHGFSSPVGSRPGPVDRQHGGKATPAKNRPHTSHGPYQGNGSGRWNRGGKKY